MTNAHATMKLLTMMTKVEKKNIIIYMNNLQLRVTVNNMVRVSVWI